MERNKDQTRQRIIDAVGRLLATSGFSEIGINAVARAAACDKVLIYRYFGGLPELLDAYARESVDWPTIEVLLPENPQNASAEETTIAVLTNTLRELRRRATTQEIMRWELLERNDLTDKLAARREKQGEILMKRIFGNSPIEPETDFAAIGAILHAGLTHLVLRSKTADQYVGVSLKSERGWKRIETAIAKIVKSTFAAADHGDERKG